MVLTQGQANHEQTVLEVDLHRTRTMNMRKGTGSWWTKEALITKRRGGLGCLYGKNDQIRRFLPNS